MKCKDLFKNSEVVFVPVEDDRQKQENQITQYAFYHNIKVRIEMGLWLNPATTECEKILKITYLGESEKKENKTEYKSEKVKVRMERMKKIRDCLKKGMSVMDIARIEGCSKQNIYQFIKIYGLSIRGGVDINEE